MIYYSQIYVQGFSPSTIREKLQRNPTQQHAKKVCVIGGGVSGLTAAAELGQDAILLESSATLGGRVQSDLVEGFILDRGFAVFIEEYPAAKKLLDYDRLDLHQFLPGALIKTNDRTDLARVVDPLRGGDLLTALFTPVGTFRDKLAMLPLLINVRTKSIQELFQEPETDTLSYLQDRFSNDMISKFFKPFLQGIYLCPLEEQSSRMLLFVMKMFSEGAATLPAKGMQAVADQLAEKATNAGVEICRNRRVTSISKESDGFLIKCSGGPNVVADSVICATEGPAAKKVLSTFQGLDSLADGPDQPQRSVGCLYYTFNTPVPVSDPILILNGVDNETESLPVNNICFPSVVSSSYAPPGYGLCSVTVLGHVMESFQDSTDELDTAVRRQLVSWFPDYEMDILEKWNLKGTYHIKMAQPAQLYGPMPAIVNGGRTCDSFLGQQLPPGLFVCGDYMATATLNGALESGLSAARAASTHIIAQEK